MTNPYCEVLGIDVPRPEEVVGHPEASNYGLFLVALLEAGGPLTLEDVADRLAEAGVGAKEDVLRALKRSRPDRPPVYRHGDLYHLDPFDDDLDRWAFRVGLREPSRRLPVGDPATEGSTDRAALLDEARVRDCLRNAAMRCVVIHGFPTDAARALVLLDVDEGRVERLAGDDLATVPERLAAYDVVAGVGIRPLLLGLGMDVSRRRLHELRPPQKTIQMGRRGRVVDVTMERLLQGSCGIRRSWGRTAPAQKLLDAGKIDRLLDRLTAEVLDLGDLYRYGRIHGAVRIRWRGMDQLLRVRWVALFEEWRIRTWMLRAAKAGQPVEVVAGAAPDRDDPWAESVWCTVYDPPGYLAVLVTADRQIVETDGVQRLRMARPGPWHAPLPAEAAGPSTQVGVTPRPFGSEDRVLRVRVSLELEREPVWRLLEVPAGYNFWDLHVAIQDAMGWLDYHLHAFEFGRGDDRPPLRIGIPVEDYDDGWEILPGWEIPVLDVLNAERPDCEYEYDFGDGWRHRVRLESIAPADPALAYPRCVAGERACPPEDVGGPGGYEDFLEVIADPTHEDHEQYLTWAGGSFDPDAFRLEDESFDEPAGRWAYAFAVR